MFTFIFLPLTPSLKVDSLLVFDTLLFGLFTRKRKVCETCSIFASISQLSFPHISVQLNKHKNLLLDVCTLHNRWRMYTLCLSTQFACHNALRTTFNKSFIVHTLKCLHWKDSRLQFNTTQNSPIENRDLNECQWMAWKNIVF